MPLVTFQPSGKRLSVSPGTSLQEACRQAGFALPAPCGGKGTCGKCRLRILAGDIPADERQRACLSPALLAEGWRLACQSEIHQDLTLADPLAEGGGHVILTDFNAREVVADSGLWQTDLTLPEPSREDQQNDLARLRLGLAEAGRSDPDIPLEIIKTLPGKLRAGAFACRVTGLEERVLAVEARRQSQTARRLGFAVDLGTTTLAGALCDLDDGEILAVASAANPQAARGDDVITRVDYAAKDPVAAREMQSLAVQAIEELARRAAGEAGVAESPLLLAVGGNTVMNHLLLGVEAGALALSPFVPCFRAAPPIHAETLGWRGRPAPLIMIVPNIAAYVGGDITAGIVAHQVMRTPGNVLFLDVGTNGEIVLAANGRVYACAAAAGPAFEGARIRQGMRATAGAVSRVELSGAGDIEIAVVGGNRPARGICGTGLLDAVAALRRLGVIDDGGRMLEPAEAAEEGVPAPALKRLHLADDGPAFWLEMPGGHGDSGVALQHRDVREFQLAKGAVAAGARVLLELAGLKPEDVDQVLLAGGFGNYLRPETALGVGLLPGGIRLERVKSVGNAALAGTRLFLLSRAERQAAEEASREVRYVELSGREDFQIAFAEEMLFP